ncbi:ComEC/Rec2 family competence protein [Gramella sp. AN32]|uniref:ComEC/Rec2 family competence protein n=1 Tax=Christiangramia antarctica TaxID=2058158 RepID=A0ABW5X3P0_9FLAO|nr:ComEC/Rec2 family competence protein [Gramella sp. AN32]MCM4156658.1 hypothetical protein [Gramella sp. AN32]
MKRFSSVFLKLSISLILGILFYFTAAPGFLFISIFFGISLIIFILLFLRARRLLFPDLLFGISVFMLIFSCGSLISAITDPGNNSTHYSKFEDISEDFIAEALVLEELKPTAFNSRYIVEVRGLYPQKRKFKNVEGKLLINLKADSLHPEKFEIGESILFPFKPEKVNPPRNPYQFDYSKYLANLKIIRQQNLSISEIKVTGSKSQDIKTAAGKIRSRLIEKLNKTGLSKDQSAVFQALILGQRREISDSLYKNYAAAGAVHILAISGLHIGILLLFLNFLFKPMEKLKYGKVYKSIILIVLLWTFAIFTGLSPSVVRAVCMFSFLAVGLQLNRKTSALNSVFLSLFFLLIIDPYFIFQVGFQLSYLAVIGIIVLQPLLYSLFRPRFKVLDYLWKLISVSIAAQLAVLPLSLFYFHQFPGLFLFSNIIILPFLGLILGLGLLIIILISFGIDFSLLIDFYGNILELLNHFVNLIAHQKAFLFENISFSVVTMLLFYLFLMFVVSLWRKFSPKKLRILLGLVIIFQLNMLYEAFSNRNDEIVIFHSGMQSIIGKKLGKDFYLYKNGESSVYRDYAREKNIQNIFYKDFEAIQEFGSNILFRIDSIPEYPQEITPDILILSHSPKLNLERLIQDLKPKFIVADGSNYKTYIDRWKATSQKKEIPFHSTYEKGVFVISKD